MINNRFFKPTVAALALVAVSSSLLFKISYDVQALDRKLSIVNHQIRSERQAIQVLNAEWTYLNDPIRLDRLVRAHSLLQPSRGSQMVRASALPYPPPNLDPEAPYPAPLRKPSSPVPVPKNDAIGDMIAKMMTAQ